MRWLCAALLLGCGSSSLRGVGEECVASSQCQAGLVCNLGVEPHVCSMMGQAPPDAPPAEPDAHEDIPDADPNQPDAPPTPDSPPGTPDARPPDARPPDARLPDAPPIDAMIDAP